MASLFDDLRDVRNLPVDEHDGPVEVVSTHASHVFLTKRDVFKIKRAKNFGFLDYSTLELREHFCHEEVRLNRRAAPGVYLGVLSVRLDDAGHSLVRDGEVVDYVVHMRRLPIDRSAEALLARDQLGHDEIDSLAAYLRRFYASVPHDEPSPGALATSIRENFRQARPFVREIVPEACFDEVVAAQSAWLEHHGPRLAERRSHDGHGDLRLEHVYFMDDGPIAIDCIEFTERFRVGDWALDVAFLAMDLADHGRPDLADSLLARLAFEFDDYDFWPLVDGYVSYRAFVRGKVACFVAADAHTAEAVRARKVSEARRYFALARDALIAHRPAPVLVCVGGKIASGKSTVASVLARRASCAIVSADATRKSLAGLAHTDTGPASIYTPEFSSRVHDELIRRAELVLQAGRSVIVDTTFGTKGLRSRFRELAERLGARFVFVECRTDEAESLRRLRARGSGEVSDAREEQWATLSARFEEIDEFEATCHLIVDGALPASRCASAVLERWPELSARTGIEGRGTT
ncbi:MAG: AAA family ATPase [Planctomycetes bacterium]|nr:AAA family ATPase [Planctomycetota bacterium]